MKNINTKHKVGIIGGMGPEATVLLMARIIELTDASDDADHVPLIVDSNTQVPSRINAIIDGSGKSPATELANMAKNLESSGAKALAMPCNTAHYYSQAIEDAVSVPLLSMVDLTAKQISTQITPNSTVGVLASPAVAITGLYDKALSSYQLKTIYPHDQDLMLDAIQSIKKSSQIGEAHKIMQDAALELNYRGADLLLIACSELSLAIEYLDSSYSVIDSMDVLAQAVIDFATGNLHKNP